MADRISPANWRLCVITDERVGRGRSHLRIAEEAIRGGADVIQLRDKEASGRTLYEIALALRRLTLDANVPFIVNDRVDVAMAVGADGVHLGQQDLPASAARAILGPGRILGVSAETVADAVQAERDGADYLGVGPVFEARGTKADAGEPLGLGLIARIRGITRLPIVAIGGINAGNAREVRAAGADAAAVISAVVGAEDIAQAARGLKDRLCAAEDDPGK
jgi:thiamine-phosphate pyrophosphorylase